MSYFNEELSATSAEEYQGAKRKAESLRRRCEGVSAERDCLQADLKEGARVFFAERGALMLSLPQVA